MNTQNLSNNTSARDKIEGRINPEKTDAMTIGNSGGVAFENASQLMEFAKMMSVAGVAIPKHLRDSPGACMAVILQAGEWRMSAFAVANKSYSVNDRLAYEAQLINAVILRRAPIRGRFKIEYSGAGDLRKCKVSVMTSDGDMVEYESPPISLIPVKNSPLWKGDPDQQLFYYSSRAMCRRHFPDVLLGVYTMDEIQDDIPMERQATGRVVTENPMKIENPYRETFADIPEPQPPAEPEPQPSAEAPPESPTDVSEATERAELIAKIRTAIKAAGSTMSAFAGKVREAGLVSPGVQVIDAPVETLREIAANVADILAGQYVPIS